MLLSVKTEKALGTILKSLKLARTNLKIVVGHKLHHRIQARGKCQVWWGIVVVIPTGKDGPLVVVHD